MASTSDKLILIVEDDKDLRDVLYDFFVEEGAKVFSANNGKEAMQIILTNQIDLILSDVQMPEMDGLELLQVIKVYSDKIPLVWLMSGQSDLNEKSAIALGAEGLINKPFNLHLAFERIVQSLEKKIKTSTT